MDNLIKYSQFGCLIVLAIILGSCSKTTSSSVDPLVGTWKATCIAGSDETPYVSMTAEYTSASSTATMIVYSEAACAATAKVFTVVITATWTKGAAVTGVDGAYNIDSVYSKVEMQLHQADIVTYFNSTGACGGSWTKDTAKELTATAASCTGFPKTADKNFDIYKIDGTKLLLGKQTSDKDATTAEKRPTELETTVSLTKQ